MQKTLVELLHDVEQEMLRLGYSKNYMSLYRRRWQMLLQFAQEQNETFYSESLGIAFVKKHSHHTFEKDSNCALPYACARDLRVIGMVGNFQSHQTILRPCCKHKEILTDPYFISIRDRFRTYCVTKDYSKSIVGSYVTQSEQFMDYLVSHNIADCKSINLLLIQAYIKTLAGYAYATVEKNICNMRAFFRFLLEAEEIKTNFAEKIPMIQVRKQTRIPSVWTKDELKKLIDAIDRGSPKGKRDYAIILLACCLGIRCGDIKNLKIEHFYWEEKKLIFAQSKTKTPISLPLTAEVGWAVIDYLKYGRPKTDSSYLFVRHLAPFVPFSESDHLSSLIRRYMQLAHIPISKTKRGMHSLRHTMASMLLEKDTPLPIISTILGHTNVDSTAVYLKVGIKKLKECALTFGEAKDHE